jgi:site-specific DNA recombinase
MRIPARAIDRLVWDRVARLFGDPIELIATAWLEVRPEALATLYTRCAERAATPGVARRGIVAALIEQVRVADDRIEIVYRTRAIADLLDTGRHPDAPDTIADHVEVRVTRAGRAVRLIQGGDQPAGAPSASLIGLLVQARRWWTTLREGKLDLSTLAAREGVTASWITRVARLAFLSPELVEAILAGRQPADLDARALTLDRTIEPSWQRQRGWLKIALPNPPFRKLQCQARETETDLGYRRNRQWSKSKSDLSPLPLKSR